MTILASDIKIFASEIMTDDTDGGQFMSGTVVQDGLENNIFQDISDLDRSRGRINLRKVYAAVVTSNQDTYLGVTCIMNSAPLDPGTEAFIFDFGSESTTRAQVEPFLFPQTGWEDLGLYPKFIGSSTIGATSIICYVRTPEAYASFLLQDPRGTLIRIVVTNSDEADVAYYFETTITSLYVATEVSTTITFTIADALPYGIRGQADFSSLVDSSYRIVQGANFWQQQFIYSVRLRGVTSVVGSLSNGALSVVTGGVVRRFGITGTSNPLYPYSGEAQYQRAYIFRVDDTIVVHHTGTIAAATYANGNTVNVGRTRIAEFRVFGNDGLEVNVGFTGDKTTGILTFTDVSSYVQPMTITSRIEDMTSIKSMTDAGGLKLNRALTHDFPSGSYVSSAVVWGDLQARTHIGFQQTSFNGVFNDTQDGSTPLADYNEGVNPITITNAGAIYERWAILFTGSTTFKVIGEQVGVVLNNGSTSTPTSPLNPATLVPYFTIPSAGWGAGWTAGNVYRFNTTATNKPLWLVRSVKPSDPYVGVDKVSIAVRGDVNA